MECYIQSARRKKHTQVETEQQAYWFTAFSNSNGTFHRTRTNDLKMCMERLPWWSSGWEPACQCRGPGFNPWSGKIPHAVRQLSPCATTTEAPVPQSPCTTRNSSPLTTVRESPGAATKSSQKYIYIYMCNYKRPQTAKAILRKTNKTVVLNSGANL